MRRFLTPGWLVLHLVVTAFLVASFLLGGWQWDRAQEAGGGAQNLGYALQWPLFGLFAVFAWWRLLRLERQRNAQSPAPPSPSAPAAHREAPPRPPPFRRPAARPDPDEEVDEELAAYNRFLASLHERDRDRVE